MRCKEIFNGHNFAFGLFESIHPGLKPRSDNLLSTGAIEAYADALTSGNKEQ